MKAMLGWFLLGLMLSAQVQGEDAPPKAPSQADNLKEWHAFQQRQLEEVIAESANTEKEAQAKHEAQNREMEALKERLKNMVMSPYMENGEVIYREVTIEQHAENMRQQAEELRQKTARVLELEKAAKQAYTAPAPRETLVDNPIFFEKDVSASEWLGAYIAAPKITRAQAEQQTRARQADRQADEAEQDRLIHEAQLNALHDRLDEIQGAINSQNLRNRR